MKILSAEYITSVVKQELSPNTEHLPEFIFMGRSNVGKSSFINTLTQRKNLAYTSSKPGKTLTLNYFLINNSFYFIDVPGYGYAERSYNQKQDFGKMMEDYLHKSSSLKNVFLIVDSKIKPTEDDLLMYDYLLHYNKKVIIVATKVDKLNQKEKANSIKLIQEAYSKTSLEDIYFVSSQSKVGIDKIMTYLDKSLMEEEN